MFFIYSLVGSINNSYKILFNLGRQNRFKEDCNLNALDRIVPNLDICVLLHSLSNRYGCACERIHKSSNPKDSRVRVNTSTRPSDLLRQRLHTHSHA